jgi:hypothetical protein
LREKTRTQKKNARRIQKRYEKMLAEREEREVANRATLVEKLSSVQYNVEIESGGGLEDLYGDGAAWD